MAKYYIGFDCGTQSAKTALYRDDMVCMAKTQIATNLKCPKPEWLEMDVDDYLNGVIEGIKYCIETSGINPNDIRAICGDGVICGIVGVDKDLNPIKEKWEKEKELRLSDAYIVKDGEPSLELKVKVINIRQEEHHEILEKCQVLKEYSQFMEIVQNYQISGEEEPYKKAIKECIEKGILADYLMRKGSEVVNMLLDEYDYETDIEVQREEAREEGRKLGREEGRMQGREEGREEERKEFLQKICSLIQKKLEKGKTVSEIANDLEDTEENISHLIKQFHLN